MTPIRRSIQGGIILCLCNQRKATPGFVVRTVACETWKYTMNIDVAVGLLIPDHCIMLLLYMWELRVNRDGYMLSAQTPSVTCTRFQPKICESCTMCALSTSTSLSCCLLLNTAVVSPHVVVVMPLPCHMRHCWRFCVFVRRLVSNLELLTVISHFVMRVYGAAISSVSLNLLMSTSVTPLHFL